MIKANITHKEVALLKGLIEDCLDFVVHRGVVAINLIVCGDAHGLAIGAEGQYRHIGVANISLNQLANIFGHHLLFKLHGIIATTGEIDAAAQAAHAEADGQQHNHYAPDGEALLVSTHKFEMSVLHQILGEASGESEVEPLVFVEEMLEHDTGEPNGGEHTGQQTDNQCGGEAADWACASFKEDDTGDNGGNV